MTVVISNLVYYCRYQKLTYWTGALVIAAGEMASRAQMVSKLMELADVLSDKLGNLVSFMAIMDGLALPQVYFISVT